MSRTEIEPLAARMVGIGFDGADVPETTVSLLKRGVGAVIFFSRNVQSAEQFADLTADLKSRVDRPLLTTIDQEGGRVQRLREPFTIIPAMGAVGQAGDETLARQLGQAIARELRAVNIDMNLAPVLDVDTNPGNPVIGARSFGRTPQLVSRMGVAVIQGLQSEGVGACGKHFPGHGDTTQDSHHVLPMVDHSMQRLRSVELVPFAAAIGAGVAAIMTAHVIFKPLDSEFPATMSKAVLDGILRREMSYDGVIFSDDMQMKAIADHYGFDEAIIRGANAGVDLFLVCHSPDLQNRAIDVLIAAVERGEVPRWRLEQSNRRLDQLFARYVRPACAGALPQLVGSAEHRTVAEHIVQLAGAQAVALEFDPTEPHR